MAATPSKQHGCSVKGCTITFSTQDSHRECFVHRSCEWSREHPIADGRFCDECHDWSKELVEAFFVRRQRRLSKADKGSRKHSKKAKDPKSDVSQLSKLQGWMTGKMPQLVKHKKSSSLSQVKQIPLPRPTTVTSAAPQYRLGRSYVDADASPFQKSVAAPTPLPMLIGRGL